MVEAILAVVAMLTEVLILVLVTSDTKSVSIEESATNIHRPHSPKATHASRIRTLRRIIRELTSP